MHIELMNVSCYQLWSKIFTPNIYEVGLHQTNLCAHFYKNDLNFHIDVDEVAQFLGIILDFGYNLFPPEHHHRFNQKDLGLKLIAKTMKKPVFCNQEIYAFCK